MSALQGGIHILGNARISSLSTGESITVGGYGTLQRVTAPAFTTERCARVFDSTISGRVTVGGSLTAKRSFVGSIDTWEHVTLEGCKVDVVTAGRNPELREPTVTLSDCTSIEELCFAIKYGTVDILDPTCSKVGSIVNGRLKKSASSLESPL